MSIISYELFAKLFRIDRRTPRIGFLAEGDADLLLALLSTFAPRRVAEFGVGSGEVAEFILKECPFIESYLGIDMPPGLTPTLPYQRAEVPENPGWAARDDSRFRLLVCPRGTFDLTPDDIAPVDFVFIDGDHSVEGVRHDTWLARESRAKTIVWHDYNNPPAIGPRIIIDQLNQSEGDHICLVEGTTVCFEIRH